MKLLLRLKDWQKIVNGEKKEPKPLTKLSSYNPSTLASLSKKTSTISAEKNENNFKFIKLLANWYKKNTEAIALFICNIDQDFLDKTHIYNTVKAIQDHLQNQFGKRGFTLQYILFIHLMTSRLSTFNSLQDFQINFKSTLSKIYKSGKLLLKDLQITTFLYRVEEIDS